MNELPQNIQVKTESVQNIADSIRAKNHSNQKYKIGEMSGAIDDMKVAIPNTMLTIEHNGVYDVSTDEKVSVEVPLPSGSVTLTSNGTHDVTQYASADVQVPEPTGTIGIGTNGTFNVKDYEFADVNTPTPSGSITITENGTHTVTNYVQAIVNVPLPKLTNGIKFRYMALQQQTLVDNFLDFLNKCDKTELTDLSNFVENATMSTSVPINWGNAFMSIKPTTVQYMFQSCTNLVTAPQLDLSNCTNFQSSFARCTNLTNVPEYDWSYVCSSNTAGLYNCFWVLGNSLTQDSVDNILKSCISVPTSATGTKTLAYLFGNVPSNVSTKAQDSQYYQDFLDSGWTIS